MNTMTISNGNDHHWTTATQNGVSGNGVGGSMYSGRAVLVASSMVPSSMATLSQALRISSICHSLTHLGECLQMIPTLALWSQLGSHFSSPFSPNHASSPSQDDDILERSCARMVFCQRQLTELPPRCLSSSPRSPPNSNNTLTTISPHYMIHYRTNTIARPQCNNLHLTYNKCLS